MEGRCDSLRGQRVGVLVHATAQSFALLAALDRLACDVFLISGDLSPLSAMALGRAYQLSATIEGDLIERLPDGMPGSGQSTVTILTSGTTGVPKAARHTWSSLARPVRTGGDVGGANWMLCYRPELYAGLQVTLQCFANGGTLVVPAAGQTASEVARLGRDNEVTFISATPSYWRWLLTLGDREILRSWRLRQITLGGEAVDQRILDQLAACFPSARLIHIYATTELGRCFSVNDGKAGFPARFLEQASPDGVALRLEDGELLVRSANAMRGYDVLSVQAEADADWFHTGDLVERRGDRCVFVGRQAERINVGGNKVNPLRVEEVVQSVEGVRDARVYGKTSSIVGQLVACEIVVDDGRDAARVLEAVRAACSDALAVHERPRIINVVDRMSLSRAGKKLRSGSHDG